MKKNLPTWARVLLVIASVLICVALFVSTVATIVVADVRLVTSKNGLQTIISQALFPTSAPARISSPRLAVGAPVRMAESGSAQSAVVDAIYGMLQDQYGEELPISQEQIESFLEESTMSDFLTEKVAGIINDIYTGNNTTTITREEVEDLLRENADLIQQKLHVTMDTRTINIITKWVEDSDVMGTVQQQVAEITGMEVPGSTEAPGATGDESSSNKGSTPSNKEVISSVLSGDTSALTVASVLQLIRSFTSVGALLGCIGICLALIGLLFLTHWGRPFAAMRTAGIPVMLAGITMAVPGVLAMAVPSLFTDTVMIVIRQVLSMTGYVSIGVAVLGLALIVCGIVLGNMMPKKQTAAPTEEAAPAPEEAAEETPAEETTPVQE